MQRLWGKKRKIGDNITDLEPKDEKKKKTVPL